MSSLKYWIWLASVSGVRAEKAVMLIDRFETPERVFYANPEEYKDIAGVYPYELEGLKKKDITRANKILEKCEENNYRVITMQDSEYPDRLKNIYDPPTILYIRGKLPIIDEEAAVGIVGTRKCTAYGLKETERVGYELAKHGLLVVTGLARGIDSAAAIGALRGGGRVLGVLGCGLDVVYPRENKRLFEDVSSYGAIISEYPPGTEAAGANFPVRNRIISGVSLGVAVIEAPLRSGALITASRALEQGRDVFAMPGNVDSTTSMGSNMLLRDGAIPLLSGENIAEEYAALYPEKIKLHPKKFVPLDAKGAERLKKKYVSNDKIKHDEPKKEIDNTSKVEYIDLDKIVETLEGDEKLVAKAIGLRTLHIDEIITACSLPAAGVLSALTMLEIAGYAEQFSGKHFKLCNPER